MQQRHVSIEMEQFGEFFSNHPLLVTALIGVGGMLLWNLLGDALSGVASVDPFTAVSMMNHQHAVVVDVRDEHEHKEGHIIGAILLPLGGLANKLQQLEKYRERPIIIGCRSGNRSAHACRLLKKNGFNQVFNLQGGILAWQNANLPVVKK